MASWKEGPGRADGGRLVFVVSIVFVEERRTGGGRGDDTGSRRGEEMGVTSHLSSWLGEWRMPTFCLTALIGLQGCSKGDLFLSTRAPREQEGIIDSQEATRTESLEFFCCQC